LSFGLGVSALRSGASLCLLRGVIGCGVIG